MIVMKKELMKTLTLCLLCIMCLCTTCLAAGKNENWAKCFSLDDYTIFYADTNSIKAIEYDGRKYLEIRFKRKAPDIQSFTWKYIERTTGDWHLVFDIERCVGVTLEGYNKFYNPQRWTGNISNIKNGWNCGEVEERILEWVSSNYPSLIDEIMQYNHDNKILSPMSSQATMTISRNTSGVGGKYKMISEDGLLGITFDYNPDTNIILLYNKDESTPYSSQKYKSWTEMIRNSQNDDIFNGTYNRNSKGQFLKVNEKNVNIYDWTTYGLLTFLRTRAWKNL